MSTFTEIITAAKNAETLHDKGQLLTYLGRALSSNKKKITPADRSELGAFALSELEAVPARLDEATCYREKDEITSLMDSLVNLVMICFETPANLPPDKIVMIQGVVDRCNRERFLETAIDEAFKGTPNEADMKRILCMAAPLKDEFQKGQLWQGLVHYKEQVNRLSGDAKAVLTKYAASELSRYAEEQKAGTLTKDGYANLEYVCDAAGSLMLGAPANPELVSLIADLLEIRDSDIRYYALSTLLSVGNKVPDEVIAALAGDMVYADLTYSLLERHRMTDRFPARLRDPVYLAKSHLVHWLVYPTELGKEPDAIEYIGQTKKKGELFHIFRYKSDSENLGDDLRDVWLIGWAGSEGSTFSNFDRYTDYEQKTPEKTVKYIRRKLL